MKANFQAAYDALQKLGAPVFTNEDNRGNFSISAEENYDEIWADYYRPDIGDFGVSPRIDAVLTKHGLYAEWENPGKLNVYSA